MELVQNEYGDSYDITIYDRQSSAAMDISGFNTFTLTIKSQDRATTILTKSLSAVSGSTGKVRWVMGSADLSSVSAGSYIAQITMTDAGASVVRKTDWLSVDVLEKLD